MAENCGIKDTNLISKETQQRIQDTHENLFIKGIDFNQQRDIVHDIANELYTSNIKGDKKTSADIKQELDEHLSKEIEKNNRLIAKYKLLNLPESIQTVQDQIDRLNSVKSNLDLLIQNAGLVLNRLNSVNTKQLDTEVLKENSEGDEVSDTQGDENLMERTTYNDFSLTLDTKNTISSNLRKFLAFTQKTEFVNGENKPSINLIGKTSYLDFDFVFKELHGITEGRRATKQDMFEKIQTEVNNAKNSLNSNFAWLEPLLESLKEVDNPNTKLNKQELEERNTVVTQLVTEMSKHKIEMFYVNYNTYKDKNDVTQYNLRLYNDDSGSKKQRILQNWKKNHIVSSIIEDGIYSKKGKEEVLTALEAIRNTADNGEQAIKVSNLLSSLGIHLHPNYIDPLFTGDNKVYYGKGNQATGKTLIGKGEILEHILNEIPEGSNPSNYSFIDEALIQGLAQGNARFETDEFNNAFRVGDKTIYTYTMNNYLSNRERDLLDSNNTLRKDLQNVLFVQDSLYLNLLNDENSGFKDNFAIQYVSLQPLKKAKGARSGETTELSDMDYEVVKYAHFIKDRTYEPIDVNGIEHKVRDAVYFFPTNSDKSGIKAVKGVAFEAVENAAKDYIFSNKALNLFYDSIVLPEIKRISATSNPNFNELVNLKSYEGGQFYLVPSLNDLVVDEKGTKLVDIAKGQRTELTQSEKEAVFAEITKVLKALSEQKEAKWRELGLLNQVNSMVHLENIKNSDNKYYGYKQAIGNQVFNYMLANANMFQLVIGDPCQYFKSSKTGNLLEDLKTTYDNIGKRLAGEVAPGMEGEGKDFFQIYMKDIETESSSIEYLEKMLGKDLADKYRSMKETDAQEYTTWKEHLNLLKSYGKINQTEYNEASAAFKEERNPSKEVFNKVLQPLKPVYVWNDIRKVGDLNIDVKTYIKSSSFPLIPSLCYDSNGKPLQINKLRLAMQELENSSTNNPQGLGVHATYASAVKVGFPYKSLELNKDKQGNFVDKIDLGNLQDGTAKYAQLRREGYKIQQDLPYDEFKEFITKGSQESKLLFTNISDPILKQQYIDTYQELYKLGVKDFEDSILVDGKVDNIKLSQKLKDELLSRGETSKPLHDALEVIDGKFALPLWLNSFSDKFSSLITSIVKKIISHEMPGKSFILGSRAGFKPELLEGEKGQQFIDNNKTGIVLTDSYDPTKGLQGQRVEDGVVKPAQVMVRWNFRDNEGKLLDINNFFVKGTKTLDYTKLPKEILQSFGFRIPTQLHASMSFIEIVGFLPKTCGDLIIAPAEFTVQMGSDFDVDKLYTYMYATQYNTRTGVLSKVTPEKHAERVENAKNWVDIQIKQLKSKGINTDELQEDIKAVLDSNPNKKQLESQIATLYPNYINSITEYVNAVKRYNFIANHEDIESELNNKLLDIHLQVMKDKTLQKNIHSPLGFGLYTDVIKELKSLETKDLMPIISDQYQENKFFDGTAGKSGIGFFSSDSIFNALAQRSEDEIEKGKGLQLMEIVYDDVRGKNVKQPVSVEFGDKYNVSNGELSKTYTNRKGSTRFKTEVIAAAQNLSVDNANEQGMYVVNMNQNTFKVYSILNFLGFEEDISAPFMSQPIIKDYVTKLKNSKGLLTEFNPNAANEIVDKLIQQYGKGLYKSEEHSKLADFKGHDASKAMLSLIKLGEGHINFGLYQAAILEKFKYLESIEKPLASFKQLLNLDSKGFSKNMYINKRRQDTLYEAQGSLIKNVGTLFGQYVRDEDNLTIIPTTTAGFDNIYGNDTLIEKFGDYSLESDSRMQFDRIVNSVEKIVGKELNESQLIKLKSNYKNYLISNINVKDIDSLRKDFLLNKGTGSLYDRLTKLQATKYGKKNKFLNSLNVTFSKFLEIDYNNSSGDMFDESNVYKSFIDLFRDSNNRNGGVPAKIAEDLITYSLLRGGNKAQQFSKFIPIEALNSILGVPYSNMNTDTFIDQWVKHNPQQAILATEGINFINNNVLSTSGSYPDYIRVKQGEKENLFRRNKESENQYNRVNQLGKENTTEYTPYDKEQSVFADNNINKDIKTKENINPLDKPNQVTERIQVKNEPINSDITWDKLNFNNLHDLLTSIVNLNTDKYKEQSKLANIFLPFIDNNLKITRDLDKGSYFDSVNEVININTNKSTGKALLDTILHEVTHSLSSNFIYDFDDNKEIPLEVNQSLTRLNGYKNQVIDNLTKQEKEDLGKSIVYYITRKYDEDTKSFSPIATAKINKLLNGKSVHPYIKDIVRRTQTKLLNRDIEDTFVENTIIEGNKLSQKATDFYYSLMDLHEFVANGISKSSVRTSMMNRTGNKYLEGIKNLFTKVLNLLGITDDESKKFLTDLFTASGINNEVIEDEGTFTPTNKLQGNEYINQQELNELEEEGKKLIEECNGSTPKAKRGMRTNIESGGAWSIVKDLKGLPSHKQGGVDLSIENGNVHFSNGKSKFHAKHGVYIPSKPTPLGETITNYAKDGLRLDKKERSNIFTKGYEWKQIEYKCGGYAEKGAIIPAKKRKTEMSGSKWSLIQDLEGLPTHKQGGVNLSIEDGKVHFAKGESKIHAKCGCLIQANKPNNIITNKTRISKNKQYVNT